MEIIEQKFKNVACSDKQIERLFGKEAFKKRNRIISLKELYNDTVGSGLNW